MTVTKIVQRKCHDIEMSICGILRVFGLKVGPTTMRGFEGHHLPPNLNETWTIPAVTEKSPFLSKACEQPARWRRFGVRVGTG
jgi:hypothetical protein